MVTISYDCQKNQLLPKVTDQSAYYSYKIYMYTLTAVIRDSNLRSVSAGCGGQNKNSTMIGMLGTWFLKSAPNYLK